VLLTEQNLNGSNGIDMKLDEEWVSLIKLAQKLGLSIDDVRQFFKEYSHVSTSQN